VIINVGKSEVNCDCAAIHEDILKYVRDEIVPDSDLTSMSKLFKIFGDGTRIRIMSALNCHEMCVCDIAVLLDMTKSAVSHQLKVLRDNNLVKFQKKGKHAYYSLADDHVREILDVALEHINE
jgi:ArsR family transcriptional regulator, lead/cadmium/zinc/bismuth-responsive transcriptional repressor